MPQENEWIRNNKIPGQQTNKNPIETGLVTSPKTKKLRRNKRRKRRLGITIAMPV